MTCPAGMFMVNLIDLVLAVYSTLLVCLVELVVIAYIYGKTLEFLHLQIVLVLTLISFT